MLTRAMSRAAGFTLVEVLLATVLIGIMMLLLTGSLRVGVHSWETGEERMAKASRLFIVGNFLRQHIGTLLPVSGVSSDGEMEPAFRGTESSLTYIAPLPDQLEGGGLYRFRLYVAGQEGDRALRVSITPYQSNVDPQKIAPKPIDDLAIVDPVKDVRFSYYGTTSNDADIMSATRGPRGKWMATWRDYQMPTLIRIDIEPEGETAWPSLFIAPRTSMLR